MKLLKKIIILFICFMLVALSILSALRVVSADYIPETTDAYVNDFANILSDSTEDYIANKAATLANGAEILIVTVDYIVENDLEVFNYNLFNQWGIGSSAENNGVLITIVTQENKYWVTAGKGLEKELSASVLSRILSDRMAEAFDKQKYDAAVKDTFDEIFDIVANKYGIETFEEEDKVEWYYLVIAAILLFGTMAFGIWLIVTVIRAIVSAFSGNRRSYSSYRSRSYSRSYNDYRMPRETTRPRYSSSSHSSSSHSSSVHKTGSFNVSSSHSSSSRSSSSRPSRSSSGGSTRGGGAGRH